jgi:hypothetical protein
MSDDAESSWSSRVESELSKGGRQMIEAQFLIGQDATPCSYSAYLQFDKAVASMTIYFDCESQRMLMIGLSCLSVYFIFIG